MNQFFPRNFAALGLAVISAIGVMGGTAVANNAPSQPLTLLKTTPLPNVTEKGDFDHFAVNVPGNRLYVSGEAHHSIEVFALSTGEHLLSATNAIKTPHTLAFVDNKNELFVADGGDRSVKVLDGTDLHLIKRIALAGDPDAGIYDATKRLFYVGNGGKGDNESYSEISVISVDKMEAIGAIRVESDNLESMAIDEPSSTLYVNMRDKNLLGVVDLAKRSFVRSIHVAGTHMPTPMAYDAKDHVLMIGERKPGTLLIVNCADGSVIESLPSVETADDMTFDPVSGRIYVSGASGLDVFVRTSPNHYALRAKYDTLGGKTSIFVPSLHRFFVVHTTKSAPEAGLQVFRVNA